MFDDSLDRNPSAATALADYDAIRATIVATDRGRWFLDEYARRHRGADTALVLSAIGRIEEAIRGPGMAEQADVVQRGISAVLETIRQTRSDVIGRHGDPAASGEAAIADFRYAAEQLRELMLASHDGDAGPDPSGQFSFQINRLISAGDWLERSVAALRIVLGVLDELDQRLRAMVDAPGTVGEAADMQAGQAQPDASTPEWPLPSNDPEATYGRPEPLPEPLIDQSSEMQPPQPETMSGKTDWAFVPADSGPGPDTDQPWPVDVAPVPEPQAAPPTSALERLEAREYRRRMVMTTMPAEPGKPRDAGTLQAGGLVQPDMGAFDDLVTGGGPPTANRDVVPARPLDEPLTVDWTFTPAPAMPEAEPFDASLTETGGHIEPTVSGLDTPTSETAASSWATYVSASQPEATPELLSEPGAPFFNDLIDRIPDHPPAQEPPAAPEPAAGEMQAPAHDAGADIPSVAERLERMHAAVAALMDEIGEKTARRNPPPWRSGQSGHKPVK